MRQARRQRVAVAAATIVGVLTAAASVALVSRERPAPRLRTGLDAVVLEFVEDMPGANAPFYRGASRPERRALARAWRLLDADPSAAQRAVDPFGYDVVAVEDSAGRALAVLRGPGGLFVRASEGEALLVEAPHPKADLGTERLATEVFVRSRARALLVAGAHRRAGGSGVAEVTRRTDSAFHEVHKRAVDEVDVVVQIHGFADSTAPGLDAVVSRGAAPTPFTRRVAAALATVFRTCLWEPGASEPCRGLGATLNVQGQHVRTTADIEFVHVELARRVRRDEDTASRAISLLARAVTSEESFKRGRCGSNASVWLSRPPGAAAPSCSSS